MKYFISKYKKVIKVLGVIIGISIIAVMIFAIITLSGNNDKLGNQITDIAKENVVLKTEIKNLNNLNTKAEDMLSDMHSIAIVADELIQTLDDLQYNTGISLDYISKGYYDMALLHYGKSQTYHQKASELYQEYDEMTENFFNRYYKYNNELQIN